MVGILPNSNTLQNSPSVWVLFSGALATRIMYNYRALLWYSLEESVVNSCEHYSSLKGTVLEINYVIWDSVCLNSLYCT